MTPHTPQVEPARSRNPLRSFADDFSVLRTTKYGVVPILVITLLDFVQKFDDQIFGTLLPEIRRDFGTSLQGLATLISLVGFCVTLSAPLIGYFSDRLRRVRMLGLSAVASGVFSMVSVAAGSMPVFAILRGVDDASESVGNIPAGSLVADYYPVEARGRAYSLYSMPLRVAAILGPLTVGALATLGSWRLPFVVFGVPLALSGVVALVVLRDPVRGYWERMARGASAEAAAVEERPPGWGEAWRTLLGIRTLRRQIVANFVINAGFIGSGFVFQFLLFEKFHLNPAQRALIFTPAGIAAIAGILVGGRIGDRLIRYRPRRVLTITGGIIAALSIEFVVEATMPLPVVVGTAIVFAFVGGLVQPAQFTIGTLVMPARMRGAGIGLLAIALYPAGVIGRQIAGYIGGHAGLSTAMITMAPLFVIGGILYASASAFFENDMRTATNAAMASEDYRRAKAEGRTHLLLARGVDVHYGSVQVLFDVDLAIDEGEIIALLGTNGAGKSTLLRAIAGTQEASAGAILFDGRDITHVPAHEIARAGIVLMPGGRGIFPSLSVAENFDVALARAPDPAIARARLEEVFGFFPVLRERLAMEAGLLSGGEQQMVALGQAFLARPSLLMIDELSLGLAPSVVQQLLQIVRAIHEHGTTIVLVEQSVNVALTVAERAVFMEKGEVRFDGPTAELLRRPDVMRAVYLKGSGALTASPVRARSASDGPAASRVILSLEHITKRFGGRTVLDGVDLDLREGAALGLIGPNGAGKTTLFDVIAGFATPDEGAVVYDGADITKLSPPARAKRRLVRRFQDARVFPSLTVFEAVCVAHERALDVRNTFLIALQIPQVRRGEARVRARADRLIDLLELGAYRDKFVAELSTGLRRVVDLACVLAAEPKVLLLDEPSAGIAQAEAESLGPLLRRVRFETGCSLLIIEHDMPLITAVSDELVALVQGRVVARGAPDDVLTNDAVVEAYLGTDEATMKRSGVLA